jgi:nucleotide-binding universal stress UspA family protein
MSWLRKIIVGHDLREGGKKALKSAAVLAHQCGAALRLVHVIEPQHSYQRISHPLTSPYTIEEVAQKTGEKLQMLAASPELARVQVEYEVRTGKPFVELISPGVPGTPISSWSALLLKGRTFSAAQASESYARPWCQSWW